ncbi:hypothetical protein V6U81_23115 [Micromonospora sp. CPCC 205711]|uniref:hypothetical protein n=1 Tax=Micromonospora sp. CPCC 205547 TaxID=3122400 RepID=UPI002FEFD551
MRVRQSGRRDGTPGFLRRLPGRGGGDPRPPASAGVVLASVASGLPVRGRVALPGAASDSDQSRPLARGGATTADQLMCLVLAVHLRGPDGMCVGCWAWWRRLSPYPCWQVDWATSRQARSRTARFLGGRP